MDRLCRVSRLPSRGREGGAEGRHRERGTVQNRKSRLDELNCFLHVVAVITKNSIPIRHAEGGFRSAPIAQAQCHA